MTLLVTLETLEKWIQYQALYFWDIFSFWFLVSIDTQLWNSTTLALATSTVIESTESDANLSWVLVNNKHIDEIVKEHKFELSDHKWSVK